LQTASERGAVCKVFLVIPGKKRYNQVEPVGAITRQASIRRSRLQAAFAGLVDGSFTALRPVTGRMYFSYNDQLVAPLQ
jgi:hypothetical protein